MSRLAGSAISQGPYVGRIDRWSEWRPTSEEPLWLLLSGATDPPKKIEISKRRARDVKGERNGEFLAGITHDLINMEDVVGAKLYNTVKDLYLSKDAALRHMNRLFETCKACRLKCSYEFIPRRFGPKIRYKDLVRLRKTKRV